jgi:hypothetical protein
MIICFFILYDFLEKLNITVWIRIIKECISRKLVICTLKTEVMAKYLVEVFHSADKIECLRTIQIFLSSGSHFLTHSDWGCLDGEHKAWFIIEVESKEEALQIVPSYYRNNTKIIKLSNFNLREVESMLKYHETQ